MKRLHFYVIILIFSIASFYQCTPVEQSGNEFVPVDIEEIKEHIKTLASDEFEGRLPGTPGGKKTVEYLKSTFEKMGIEPGNGNSYFQDVPLVDINGLPDEIMTVKGPKGNLELKYKEDFMIGTSREVESVEVKESELVFCGYGIVAPEYGWNDYEGLDMKGKTAVVLVNDPGFESGDSTFFKGKTMTYYGRWTYKYEEAARQGADGVLIIHQTVPAGYPWFVVKSSWAGSQLHLPSAGDYQCAMEGWISITAASELFKAAPIEQTRIFEKARSKDFKPFSLGLTVSASINNTIKKDVSQNVIGKITGRERPDEYIIYVAHWDHLGIGAPVKGDSIYNGALDNATGTSSLLSIAHAFTKLEQKPERSVIFLAVTAEEQGLLGSAFYAENPIYPLNKTVGVLNMDGMNIVGPMKDLTVVGYGQSELEDYAKDEAQKQGRYMQPEQEPEKGFFFRSDQFSFAKVGVPALYAEGGYDHLHKGKEYAMEQKEKYTSTNYHQPSDEYNAEEWDLGGILQDAQLFFNIGQRLANEETWPEWKEGSEFKAKRELKD